MRMRPLGRLVVLILIAGVAFGAWRLYKKTASGSIPSGSSGNSSSTAMTPVADSSDSAGRSGSDTNAAGSGVILSLVTSPTKRDWLQVEMDAFDKANAGRYSVKPNLIETREAMQAILNDKVKPVFWSPSSPIWAARLGDAYANTHNGQHIIDLTGSNLYRVYLRTPIVFLTTKDKAAFLTPLLGGHDPWGSLRDLSMGHKKAPWGQFKYGHADPIVSNSGFLTIAMFLLDYARSINSVPSEQMAVSSGFVQYLRQIEAGLVFDAPAQAGSSQIAAAFVSDPSRYDAITTYESTALASLAKNPNLAVIYPNPTVVSEQGVAVVNGAWVVPQQREAAARFLDYLGSKESLQNGIAAHFRTAQSSGDLSLEAELEREQGRGFRQSFTSIELPGYMAINTAAYTWRNVIAKAKVGAVQ